MELYKLLVETSRKGEKDSEKAKELAKSRKNPAHFEKRGINERIPCPLQKSYLYLKKR